jgi:hypothetical protein
VRGGVPIDSEMFLMIDFVNLKIKSVQSFRDAHRGRMSVCVHKGGRLYVKEYLCLYCIFKKKKLIVRSNQFADCTILLYYLWLRVIIHHLLV